MKYNQSHPGFELVSPCPIPTTITITPQAHPHDSQQKKRTCQIADFAIPADYKVKLKESKKQDKYMDLVRELEKLWNMKVMLIPVVIGALGTVTIEVIKSLEELEIRGRVETIQKTVLLRSTKILRRVL